MVRVLCFADNSATPVVAIHKSLNDPAVLTAANLTYDSSTETLGTTIIVTTFTIVY